MTITIHLSSETEQKLRARSTATGKDIPTLVQEAIEEKLRTTAPRFEEILAPVHADFRHSDLSETDLDALLQATLAEVRQERRTPPEKAP